MEPTPKDYPDYQSITDPSVIDDIEDIIAKLEAMRPLPEFVEQAVTDAVRVVKSLKKSMETLRACVDIARKAREDPAEGIVSLLLCEELQEKFVVWTILQIYANKEDHLKNCITFAELIPMKVLSLEKKLVAVEQLYARICMNNHCLRPEKLLLQNFAEKLAALQNRKT